jgi:hypothetical protein
MTDGRTRSIAVLQSRLKSGTSQATIRNARSASDFVPKGFTCCGKVSTSLGDKAERDSHDHFTHRSTRLEQQRARQQLIRDLNKIAVVDERAGDDCSINPSIEQTEGEVISSI